MIYENKFYLKLYPDLSDSSVPLEMNPVIIKAGLEWKHSALKDQDHKSD